MHNTYSEGASPSLKQESLRFLPWIVWFLSGLFYMYESIVQVSPGVMVPDLMHVFSINSAALGGVIAFFFYSYAAMQIPVGVLVDNYNARFLLTGAVLSCAIGCILFGTATSIVMIALGRLLIGLGCRLLNEIGHQLVSYQKILFAGWFNGYHGYVRQHDR